MHKKKKMICEKKTLLMIRRGAYSEWLTFYNDDAEELQKHFYNGGTVKMLNGQTDVHSALYNCCTEDAEDCLPIMLKYGAKPDFETWDVLFRIGNAWFLHIFFTSGYLPTRGIALEYWGKTHSIASLKELTCLLCMKSVICVLWISKTYPQPLNHMWKLIAKQLWDTRFDKCWIDILDILRWE